MEPFCENHFPHSKHWNGFSPVCVRICIFRWALEGVDFPQISQVHLFSKMVKRNICHKRISTGFKVRSKKDMYVDERKHMFKIHVHFLDLHIKFTTKLFFIM